nr:uncharacterized protein LOC117846000 isoform X2 [Setaria viridis]XP_034582990.1 uncharacterized protein LOC117846000 isoform X2 [Setaria viridis]
MSCWLLTPLLLLSLASTTLVSCSNGPIRLGLKMEQQARKKKNCRRADDRGTKFCDGPENDQRQPIEQPHASHYFVLLCTISKRSQPSKAERTSSPSPSSEPAVPPGGDVGRVGVDVTRGSPQISSTPTRSPEAYKNIAMRMRAKILALATEKRNPEDLWLPAFPIGTEKTLEEGGELYEKTVYLFGSTERLAGWKV